MKTLELNQMKNVQGGTEQEMDCMRQMVLSGMAGGAFFGPIGFFAFALYASYQGVCEGL